MHVLKVAAPIFAVASAGGGLLLAVPLRNGAHAFSLNAVIPSSTTSRTSPSSSSSSRSPCSFPKVTAAVASLSAGIVPSFSFSARISSSSCFNSNFLRATPCYDNDDHTSSTTRRQTEKGTSTNMLFGVAVDSNSNLENTGSFRGLIEPQRALLNEGAPVARHAKKILKSATLALAWYLASATLAGAAEAISGGMSGSAGVGARRTARAMKRSDAKKHAAGLRYGTILCLYVLSSKNIRRRNRFDGVVPKDTESREILADDAHENAMSYGRPAGRIALLGLDLAVATLTFLYTGNALRSYEGPVPRADVAPWNPMFWDHNNLGPATFAAICTLGFRLAGHGYIRYSLGVWLAPMVLNVIVKPVKWVAFSSWGVGGDWDLGPTQEERARMNEGKMTSRQLRESLSTFEDPTVEFREQDPHYHADGDFYDDEVDGGPASDDESDAPPDLRRSS